MSIRQERKGHSHSAILAAATRLLRARGVAGTSVADVMREAGLTVGGFYAHFDSKDALIDNAIRRIGAVNHDRLFAELDAEAAQMEAVRSLLPRFETKIQRVLDRVWGSNEPE